MNGLLKVLIAAACVVVIAGGGYYAWSEMHRIEQARLARQLMEERAAEAARRKVEEIRRKAEKLAEEADRAADERRRVASKRRNAIPTLERNHCQQQLTSLRVALNGSGNLVSFYRAEVERCVAGGHIPAEWTNGLME